MGVSVRALLRFVWLTQWLMCCLSSVVVCQEAVDQLGVSRLSTDGELWARVFRVTGVTTNHYTTTDLNFRGIPTTQRRVVVRFAEVAHLRRKGPLGGARQYVRTGRVGCDEVGRLSSKQNPRTWWVGGWLAGCDLLVAEVD